jgi:hypothetical protein
MINKNGTLDLTGIKKINDYDYFKNKKLKKLIIGNTIEKIGEYSFFDCLNLEEIDFSNTILKEISYQSFYSCSSLKSIHLPSSIKFIRTFAFGRCDNLESVILDGVNKIGLYAFRCCDNLKEFVFYEDIENFKEKNIFIGIQENQKIKITCPEKYIDYFKKQFPESEINNDNQYVLK